MSFDPNSPALSPILSVRDLHVATSGRAPRPIVRGIAFDIRPGETLCLVGESGSGKSVTSLAAMGLLPPDELRATQGQVLLNGEDVVTASHRRLLKLRGATMAMVFQEPMTALNPVLRLGRQMDEVYQVHTRLRAGERRRAALGAFASVDLPDPERVYDSFPHQISGGQRQRVMIAMALALRPRLLIADEPTTALDVTTQKQILEVIRTLQREQNTAVLFITHDMGVVRDIADRVCVMRHGELVEAGTTDEILSRPRMDYTRALLAAVPSLTPRPVRPVHSALAALDVQGLGKVFSSHSLLARLSRRPPSEVRAAADVSFSLSPGRTLGIVGESGSGKSTVARCIVQLELPSSGRVLLGRNDVAGSGHRTAARRRSVQMIFQDPNRSLNPRIRVGDSLIEGSLNLGEDRRSALARAAELIETVALPADSLTRYPHQFSGGQRQRIAIARALMMSPEVIVADEAVSALDVSVQAQVLALLSKVQRERNLAILFITHDLRVAAQICDEVLVMRRGRVVEYGVAGEILAAPKERYTRDLVEAAPGRDWDFHSGRRIESAVA